MSIIHSILRDELLRKIMRDHCGKHNAITRDKLLEYARIFEPDLGDRELRAIYSELPVCVSEAGIFWPCRIWELRECIEYLKAKAIPLFERISMLEQAHQGLLQDKQMELPLEGEAR